MICLGGLGTVSEKSRFLQNNVKTRTSIAEVSKNPKQITRKHGLQRPGKQRGLQRANID